MHTEKREDPLVELGYEVRDVNSKTLIKGTLGFFIFTVASAAIGFAIFRIGYPVGFEAAREPNRLIPQAPNPILQSNLTVKTDIMDLRQGEEKALNAPIHWTDSSKTKLAIPIDRAMEIIAERGMPKTGSEVPAVTKGHTPDPRIGEKAAPAATSGIKLDLSSTSAGPSTSVSSLVLPANVKPTNKK